MVAALMMDRSDVHLDRRRVLFRMSANKTRKGAVPDSLTPPSSRISRSPSPVLKMETSSMHLDGMDWETTNSKCPSPMAMSLDSISEERVGEASYRPPVDF